MPVGRTFGVDVASFQSTSMTSFARAGARFVIVKLTEGTTYVNLKAAYQIKSAHENHMYVHGYHFATFGSDAKRAKEEANHFVKWAKQLNISKKRYLLLDWESGDGNNINNGKAASAKAIIAFMKVCQKAGYKVGLYSGASCLRNNIDTSEVIKEFGDCLWVASYAVSGRIDTPNYNYFPSMNGVAIWQFTDNWCGLCVDGNVDLLGITGDSRNPTEIKPKPAAKPKPKIPKIVYVPVINNNPNYKVRLLDKDGHYTQYIVTNSRWKVLGERTIKDMKCYKLGTEKQYVPAKFTKVVE